MNLNEAHQLCRAVNRAAHEVYGNRACCIFASRVLLDVLHALGHVQARPVRIEAAAHDRRGNWHIAGMRGVRGARAPWMWGGHMGVMLDSKLLDPTLDQIGGQKPFSGVYQDDWEHAWYAVDSTGAATQTWTKYPGEGVYAVRYVVIRDREGWNGAPDWRRKGGERLIAAEQVLKRARA